MTLIYDTKAGLFWTAMRRTYTVAPVVLSSTEFWLFFLIHIVIFTMSHVNRDWAKDNDWLLGLDWDSVKIVSGITTFFEVFYSNQCYARYVHLYGITRGMMNGVHDLCHYLRVFIGDKAKGYSRMSTRYVLLSMVLHFYEIKGRDSESELEELQQLGLVRGDAELRSLASVPTAQRSKVALAWCSFVTRKGSDVASAPPQALRRFTDLILHVNSLHQEVADTMSLPVPFQYFHLLSAMIIMNLLLWAFAMGTHESFFAPVIYFFSSFIFIGMMELSSELSDPFGTDEVDFPVDKWIRECSDMVVEMIETDFPGGLDSMASLALEEPVLSARNISDVSLLHVENEGRKKQFYEKAPYAAYANMSPQPQARQDSREQTLPLMEQGVSSSSPRRQPGPRWPRACNF